MSITHKSLVDAKLALGSFVDNVADTDCWQDFEKIWSYATIQTGKTISLHNALSQPDESLLCIIRCCTQSQQSLQVV